MLNASAIFTLPFSLPERFLVSNNISFKGGEGKDLSIKPLPKAPRSPVFSPPSLLPGGSRHSQPRTGTPARQRRTGPPPQRKGSPALWPQQPPPPGVTAPAESCLTQTSQFPGCGDRSAGERTDGAIPVLAAELKCKLDPRVPHPALGSQGDPAGAPGRPRGAGAKRAGLGAPKRRGERAVPEG